MRIVWDIAVNQLRLLTKNRVTIAVMLIMPLLFVLIFGQLFSRVDDRGLTAGHLAVTDADGSWVSVRFVDELAGLPGLTVRPAGSGERDRLFRDKDIAFALTIPAGWGESLLAGDALPLAFSAAPGTQDGPFLEAQVRQAALRIATALQFAAAGTGRADPALFDAVQATLRQGQATVEFATVQRSGESTPFQANLHLVCGFTIMFVMSLLFGRAGALLKERQDGTLRRLLIAPVSRVQLLLGYLLSFLLVGTIQFAILALAGRVLFGVVWDQPLQVAVIVLATVTMAAGLSLLLATLVRTAEQQGALGTIVLISTCMLGGVYWPLDIVSPAMRSVATFVPQSWAMDALRKAATGAAWSEVLPQTGVLLLFAAAFLAAGVPRMRYE